MIDNPRENLQLAGASTQDLAWFDAFDWRDDKVPPASAETLEDYRRREALLNKSLESMTFSERSASKAGHLAAAIGARIADLRDPPDDDDEG